MKKIVIIGAGIAGLAAAFYHKKQGHLVTVLEKSSRVGGWIRTTCEKGFVFEQGPRGFRPAGKGKHTLALVKELGLENELIAADKGAKKRFVVTRGCLHRFSLGFLLRQGLIGAWFKDQAASATEKDDETIADFCKERFNSKITQTVVDPLVKGIFGGNAEELSMKSCFPKVWEAAKKGSVMRYLEKEKAEPVSLYSFRHGMESLPKKLGQLLEKNILLNTPVIGIEKNKVILSNQIIEADQIIACVPAYALTNNHPFTYATLTTVSLGWSGSLLPKSGFGFLVPSIEKESILGMTWDSEIFPSQNQGKQTRICIMIEGEGTLDIALQAVKKYLRIDIPPEAYVVNKAVNAIPQYLLGHQKRLNFFQKQFPVEFIGNTYSGVGVNDCIEAAWKSVSS